MSQYIAKGEIDPSEFAQYISYGADISDAGVYFGGNRFCIVFNGWFTLKRAATKPWDVFHIFTMKYAHHGRQYGICIKRSTRNAFILDFRWTVDDSSTSDNYITMWGNSGSYGDIKSGVQSSFTITFDPSPCNRLMIFDCYLYSY